MPPAFGRRITPLQAHQLVEIVHAVPLDFGGGSSAIKALVLADLIIEYGIHDTVEIGVYRGRSLLPVAAVLKLLGRGRALGIDPWSADAALQQDDHEVGAAVNDWARSHPWEETYAEVVGRIAQFELGAHCQLLRTTSERAADEIADASVGLVHVDGNHDRAAVERDVERYLPKLEPGGVLVLDDASWNSVRPLVEALRATLEPVYQLYDGVPLLDDQPTDFAVFRVPSG